jgi:hypothetical protein
VAVTLSNCTQDTLDKDENSTIETSKNEISFKEFKNKTGLKNFKKTISLPSESINDQTKKTGQNHNILNDFNIDTTYIKQCIVQNKTTYTFKIIPKIITRNSIFNLIVHNKDGVWETSIIEMIPTKQNLKDLITGNTKQFKGKMRLLYQSSQNQNTINKSYARSTGTGYTTIFVTGARHCTGTGDCASGTCDNCNRCVDYYAFRVPVQGEAVEALVESPNFGSQGGGGNGVNLTDPSGYVIDPNLFDLTDPRAYLMLQKAEYAAAFWAELPDTLKTWAVDNVDQYTTILNLYLNNVTPENKVIAMEQINLSFQQNNIDVSWEEYKEIHDYLTNSSDPLKNEIVKNWVSIKKELLLRPALLLNIPCSEIPKWQELIQFTPPQSVKNKIQSLDNQSLFTDYKIQYLEHAKGAAINLDYFPVTINSLPTNPNTGQKFSPKEFLNYVRLKINSFVDTTISSFSPTTLSTGTNETQLWNSTNPLGAIIHINIPLPAGDGSVICSETDPNHWIFTTLEVPYWPGNNNNDDGIHPVSGNREFGLIENSNGTFTFYTRGVDRMTDGFDSTIAENGNIFFGSPFAKPDILWNSLKTKIFNFVQNNGGNSVAPTTSQNKIYRPDWTKVRQVLRGEVSINNLGCN